MIDEAVHSDIEKNIISVQKKFLIQIEMKTKQLGTYSEKIILFKLYLICGS